MGGAQKQLKKVAMHLAEQGHRVTILCTLRPDAAEPFNWHENVRVLPVYRFKQPFPDPYGTPTYNIADALQVTSDYMADADVWYSHDGGLIFPYVYQQSSIPAVISLRSILFSETLQAGYLFQGDALIVPSDHTAQTWLHTVGRFFPDLAERLHVIHNGLDFAVYQPTPTDAVREQLGITGDHDFILYPHRPEAAKGIRQTIAVTDKLVNVYGLTDVRVLLPRWMDADIAPDVRAFYDDLRADIARRGLSAHFLFHEWVGDELMPAYYSLGSLTLALGNYVETFGNTPYESLACGTPVLAARVGPYRDMLPEYTLVAYDDIDTAAERAAKIIQHKQSVDATTTQWLHANFAQSAMVTAYADVILNARKLPPMPYTPRPLDANTRFMLAPWCHIDAQMRLYHDFEGRSIHDAQLAALAYENPYTITFADASAAQVMGWYKAGLLVPVHDGFGEKS